MFMMLLDVLVRKCNKVLNAWISLKFETSGMSCLSFGTFTLRYQGVQGTVHSHAQASGVGTCTAQENSWKPLCDDQTPCMSKNILKLRMLILAKEFYGGFDFWECRARTFKLALLSWSFLSHSDVDSCGLECANENLLYTCRKHDCTRASPTATFQYKYWYCNSYSKHWRLSREAKPEDILCHVSQANLGPHHTFSSTKSRTGTKKRVHTGLRHKTGKVTMRFKAPIPRGTHHPVLPRKKWWWAQ